MCFLVVDTSSSALLLLSATVTWPWLSPGSLDSKTHSTVWHHVLTNTFTEIQILLQFLWLDQKRLIKKNNNNDYNNRVILNWFPCLPSERDCEVGWAPLYNSLAHKMAVHLLSSDTETSTGIITLHPSIKPKETFTFIPSLFALPVHINKCKHFNWMASVGCCDETMGKWREMRTLEQASCFPQMPPAYSISPSGITRVLLASPLHTNEARTMGWIKVQF